MVSDDTGKHTLVAKGSLDQVLALCTSTTESGAHTDSIPLEAEQHARIETQFDAWSRLGYRVIGVATRELSFHTGSYSRADESGLCFAGFLLFLDSPKADVLQVIRDLT